MLSSGLVSSRRAFRLLFAGAYGIESAGDDLPLLVMADLLRARRPGIDLDLRVLSRHPDNGDAERYVVTTVQNLEHASREAARGRWFNGLNPGDDTAALERVTAEVRACDAFVLGAGNWMIDLDIGLLRGPVPLLALYTFLARLFHRPVFLYGMSAGPLRTDRGRDLCRWVVEEADVVTVRDRSTRDLLASLLAEPREIVLLPDVTLAARPSPPERAVEVLAREGIEKRPGARWLALGLRDLSVALAGDALENAWRELAAFCERASSEYEVLFVPQCTYRDDDDRATARRFAARLGRGVRCHFVEGRLHPADVAGLYGLCDAAVAVRLHAAVFAVLARVPVAAVEYLPKVRGFMESVGLGDQVVGVERLDQIEAALERARRRAGDGTLEARLGEAAREAGRYADLLLDLLERSPGSGETPGVKES
jgi:polysaccharide pyruvyl transferase WcaK-like protein